MLMIENLLPLAMMVLMTPPTVSIPKDNGVASIMTKLLISSDYSPLKSKN